MSHLRFRVLSSAFFPLLSEKHAYAQGPQPPKLSGTHTSAEERPPEPRAEPEVERFFMLGA